MAKNMPIMKLIQYEHFGPVILSTYEECRRICNLTLYGEDELTTEDEDDEKDEEDEEDA